MSYGFPLSSRHPCPCHQECSAPTSEVVGTGTVLLLPITVRDASSRGAQLGEGRPCSLPVLLAPQVPGEFRPTHMHTGPTPSPLKWPGTAVLSGAPKNHLSSLPFLFIPPPLCLWLEDSGVFLQLCAGGGLPWGTSHCTGAGGCLSQSWTSGPVPTWRAGMSAPRQDPRVAGSPQGSVT